MTGAGSLSAIADAADAAEAVAQTGHAQTRGRRVGDRAVELDSQRIARHGGRPGSVETGASAVVRHHRSGRAANPQVRVHRDDALKSSPQKHRAVALETKRPGVSITQPASGFEPGARVAARQLGRKFADDTHLKGLTPGLVLPSARTRGFEGRTLHGRQPQRRYLLDGALQQGLRNAIQCLGLRSLGANRGDTVGPRGPRKQSQEEAQGSALHLGRRKPPPSVHGSTSCETPAV